MKKILVLVIFSIVFAGCGSKKKIVTKKKHKTERKQSAPEINNKPTETKTPTTAVEPTIPTTNYANKTEAYIANFSAIAMEEMRKYKIPASITLAQGILESGSGQGRLAVEANNHFGIKCHNWTGNRIYHDDDERDECFRKYNHAISSFEDHSIFLTSRSRYAGLFKLAQDDYKAWAKGLRAAGYATDRRYPEKLISLIERYRLYEYDHLVLGNRQSQPSALTDNVIKHEVIKGDTLYSISKRYNTTVALIKQLNQMKTNNLQIGQIIIIKTIN